jgi:quinoprotein glucose dehydrogenase
MIVLSIILLLLGLVLLAGGVWLVSLGGSLYYAIAGIALIIAGLTAKTRRPTARCCFPARRLSGAALWPWFRYG